MKQNIKEFIQAIEAQNNNSLHFDIESYLSYKDGILKAVLELFKSNSADEVLKDVERELER